MTRINIDTVASLPVVEPVIRRDAIDFPGGYDWQNTYFDGKGLLQLPMAGPAGTPAKFVRTNGGNAQRVLSWMAFRFGEIPVIPEPGPTDPNERLLDAQITPAKPMVLPDGVRHGFFISGVYYYGQAVATKVDDGLRFGIGPDDTTGATAYILKKPNFKDVFK